MSNKASDKKILEKSPIMGSLMVPIAIVLVGAVVIFGVTKMLSSERTYKDLVNELQSKTFGNKWVAAYELSKHISTNSIKEEDVPWVVQNLSQVYKETADPRTRNFTIVALGALKSPLGLPTIEMALKDVDQNVRFHAVVALGSFGQNVDVDWSTVKSFLKSEDPGLIQASIFTLATHNVDGVENDFIEIMGKQNKLLRYSSATALIYYQNEKALPVLEEIFNLKLENVTSPNAFTRDDLLNLKLNVLNAVEKVMWKNSLEILENVAVNDSDVKVVGKAKEVINVLKN